MKQPIPLTCIICGAPKGGFLNLGPCTNGHTTQEEIAFGNDAEAYLKKQEEKDRIKARVNEQSTDHSAPNEPTKG